MQTIDYELSIGVDPSATAIANISPSGFYSGGAEYYDGVLYTLLGQGGETTVSLGTMDTQTAVHTQLGGLITLDSRVFSLSMTVIPSPVIPADLDFDGDVDDADYGLFFAAFTGPNNGPSGNQAADLDGDEDVDDADFGIAFAAFTGPGGPAYVPEPGSLGLLVLSGCCLVRRRR